MNYLSICSGIEAATMGWHHLGFKPVGFSEIEPFPSAVLAHHYSDVKNFGDMTKHKEWTLDDERLDLLVGGTPCQAFSVAGARRGLDDERGNLTLTFCNIADQFSPRFTLWENVPGVLSDKTNAFGCLLSGLAGFDEVLKSADGKWRGSGMVVGRRRRVAWVTLDAQFFGVPQRRRRIFVLAVDVQSVADSPNLCPSKILSIGTSLRRDTPPRRKTGEEVASATGGGVVGSLCARDSKTVGSQSVGEGKVFALSEATIMAPGQTNASDNHFGPLLRGGQGGTRQPVAFTQNTRDEVRLIGGEGLLVGALAAQAGMKQTNYVMQPTIMAHGQANAAIRSDGGSPSLTCNHETQIVVYPLNTQIITRGGAMGEGTGFGMADDGEPAYTLQAGHSHGVAACFSAGQSATAGSIAYHEEESPTLRGGASGTNMTPTLLHKMQVRRLTPEECEILQGFPVGYTDIKLKGKPTPDGPRYKALGNSMAVPVMRWIGGRLQDAVSMRP